MDSLVREVAKGIGIEEVHGEAIQTYGDYERLVRGASLVLKVLGHPVKGRTADLGSGTGVGACLLSKLKKVGFVYAIDYSKTFVRHVMPVVFNRFDGSTEKIERVVGDFNALQLEDGTLDVILEIGAFHHSENLSLTLANCYRVLRPKGVLIAIDRAWPDYYKDEQFDEMLNRQLPNHLKQKYGIPLTSSFTCREWGEHEYLVCQYLKAFTDHGFDAAAMIQAYAVIRGINRVLRRPPCFRCHSSYQPWHIGLENEDSGSTVSTLNESYSLR